jgi:uncharacterized protein (DUF1330 family)
LPESDVFRATGRVALIDLVRCPSHEARVAFPSLMKTLVGPVGGRVVWAGSIDQQLIGHGDGHFGDVVISEYPDRQACLRALAERSDWQPESFVSELETYASVPWSGLTRRMVRLVFGGLRLLGRATPRAELELVDVDSLVERDRNPSFSPDASQLHTLVEAESSGRVVMVNFLHYRRHADYYEGPDYFEGSDGFKGPDGSKAPNDSSAPSSHGAAKDVTGEQAYGRYGRVSAPLIARLGGRIRWMGGRIAPLLDASDSLSAQHVWNSVVVVEYPSRADFIGMIGADRYQSSSSHRDAGLERTKLLTCTSHAEFF